MKSNTHNSLSDIVAQLVIQHRNSIELWDKISTSLYTEEQSIVATTTDPINNEVKNITIPALKKMQRDIEILNKSLYNIQDSSESYVRTKDGDFKKMIFSSVYQEPDSLITIETPEEFNIKNNWFFESFLNPLLYVEFKQQMKQDIKKVEVSKFLLQLDTTVKNDIYNSDILGKSDIVYADFINLVENNGIEYILDIDEIDIATKENKFFGEFDVLNIYDESSTIEINGQTENVKRKKYQLNTLQYSSKLTDIKYTESLKIGDQLIVNNEIKNTKYEITEIDASKKTIVLKLIEGLNLITIKAESLKLFSKEQSQVSIHVPVGFDNNVVLFMRPIDSNSNLISNFYSPGTSFYTNDLKIITDDNEELKLSDFYRSDVTDFGQFLLGMAKDASPPNMFGDVPDAPTLKTDNFKVVEINKHLTEKKTIKDLKRLHTEKNKLSDVLFEYDVNINELKTKLSTTNFNTNNEKINTNSKLEKLEISKLNSKATFNSIVKQINTFSTKESFDIKPKYNVRGFWDIPESKTNKKTSNQEIVQFIYSYRYLNIDGDANNPEQLENNTSDGTKKYGYFSPWIEKQTKVRIKHLDESTNTFKYIPEDIENAELNNFNQLDIPIQSGESIEIKIKSISEVGFPNNPLISDWSDIVKIDFPTDIAKDEIAIEIIKQAQRQLVKVELEEELRSSGLTQHLLDKKELNGNYYAHLAKSIDSGFITEAGNPINMFEKIKEQEELIKELQTTLNGNLEDYDIYLLNNNGDKINLKIGYNNEIFAGYYRDIIENEPSKMGSIVTQIYKLVIINKSANNLLLESLNKGSSNQLADIQNISGVNYNYDLVPLGKQNYNKHITQKKGQYIYNRFNNVKNNTLYQSNTNEELFNIGINYTSCVVKNSDFTPSLNLDPNTILVHEDHPFVSSTLYEWDSSKIPTTLPNTISLINVQSEYDITAKIGFDENDKFLIGPKTCGAFCYVLSDNDENENLRVTGETIFSERKIEKNNVIEIPIVFQFRMTDYYGDTSVGTTLGKIGGLTSLTNLTYKKTLGFDLISKFGGQTGIDIEFVAKYAPEGVSLTNLKTTSN